MAFRRGGGQPDDEQLRIGGRHRHRGRALAKLRARPNQRAVGEHMITDRYTPTRGLAAATLCALAIGLLAGSQPALAQATKYDGTYAGSQTLSEDASVNNYSQCLKGPFKRQLVVKDGKASYEYNPGYHGTVTGTVSPEGDVSATDAGGDASLSGKIQGDQFTGKIWSMICTYSLQLKRAP